MIIESAEPAIDKASFSESARAGTLKPEGLCKGYVRAPAAGAYRDDGDLAPAGCSPSACTPSCTTRPTGLGVGP